MWTQLEARGFEREIFDLTFHFVDPLTKVKQANVFDYRHFVRLSEHNVWNLHSVTLLYSVLNKRPVKVHNPFMLI